MGVHLQPVQTYAMAQCDERWREFAVASQAQGLSTLSNHHSTNTSSLLSRSQVYKLQDTVSSPISEAVATQGLVDGCGVLGAGHREATECSIQT